MTARADPLAALRLHPLATVAVRAAEGRPMHLVGGALRDVLLGLPPHDLDLVVAGAGERVAVRLAETLPARLVRLGAERFAAYRLVGGDFQLDLWDRGASGLDADLARRDFTVNSLALDLVSGEIHDPHHGRRDAERRRLRATTTSSFSADPLRIARLGRFAGPPWRLIPDAATLELARLALPGIDDVAPERIREELLAVLASSDAASALKVTSELGLMTRLFEVPVNHDEEAARSVRRDTARFERLLRTRDRARGRETASAAGRAAARLAVIARAIESGGGGSAFEIVDRADRAGRVARRHAAAARQLLAAELPASNVAARRRFLHAAGENWDLAVCVATLAAGSDPEQMRGQLEDLAALARRHGETIFRPQPLLDGREIQRLTGVEPGPELGRLIAVLRTAQVEGSVGDREQAVALLRLAAGPPRPGS